ncbi:hypothetical protein G3M48_010453 [Beauveria asiatica]|uniref:Uncharacterized protein n=1 Tax=Beauveria asiatica TaxID=1069075 RepID=A0AAW0RH43_9HYPO
MTARFDRVETKLEALERRTITYEANGVARVQNGTAIRGDSAGVHTEKRYTRTLLTHP